MQYVVQYKPKRARFIETMTKDEEQAVGAHFHYLKQLFNERRVYLIGRREDGDFGLVIFHAATTKEAEEMVANDPAVEAGVFDATVGEFKTIFVAKDLWP